MSGRLLRYVAWIVLDRQRSGADSPSYSRAARKHQTPQKHLPAPLMQSYRVTFLAYDGSGRTEARGGEVGRYPVAIFGGVDHSTARGARTGTNNAVGYIHHLLGV